MQTSETDRILLQTTANRAIRKGYVDTEEGQIHYWTAGSGEALLLIHQSSASVEEYAGLVPFLSDKYQLIAFDWPGSGNSDDPLKEPGIEEYTESALAVLNHLHVEKCHVLGHHGGALVVMNLAYKYSNRTNKLILSGTSALKSPEEAKEFLKKLELKKRTALKQNGQSILDAWKRYVDYSPEASPKQVLVPFINNIVSQLRPYDAHHGVLHWDRRKALKSLKGPVLLMQGSMDLYVSDQEKLLDILPQAERVVLEKGGAFMFYNQPKVCADIIHHFLSKNKN